MMPMSDEYNNSNDKYIDYNSIRYLLSFTLLFFTLTFFTFARSEQDSKSTQQKVFDGVIKGKICDSQTNDPLPYTNIILNNQRDSSFVLGSIAYENGNFILENVPLGNFYIEVKFIGYAIRIISDISISENNKEISLGLITIREASQLLGEVQVTAERSTIEYNIDKKVIQINESLITQGESVARALASSPSVTLDTDDNVLLRGSSNFTVLINGKPSPVDGSSTLKQIQANSIENIEIITNPSAKFDPDGLVGIINVVTKKLVLDGISGIVNASVGTGRKYRGDILINHKMSKLSYYMGGDYNDEKRIGKPQRAMHSYHNDTTQFSVSNGNGARNLDGYTIKGGLTYNLNEKNSLSFEGSVGQHRNIRTILDRFHEYKFPISNDEHYYSISTESRTDNFYNMTLNYQRIFDTKDHKFTSYLYYENGNGEGANIQDQWYIDVGDGKIEEEPYKVFTKELHTPQKLRYQIDYSRPIFKNGNLETGYQMRIYNDHEVYSFNAWDNQINDWHENFGYSSTLDLKRNIHATYGIISNDFLGISYQVGLRTEYSNRQISHFLTDKPSVINRIDLFPSIHFSNNIGKNDQVLASYSRRINRPEGSQLDPFPNFRDPKNLRIGNPELLPEYVDSYELSFLKGIGKSSFISLEGYFRLTHDKITRMTSVQDDGLRTHTMGNLYKEYAMGAEMMLNFQVAKWFNFDASTTVYKYRLLGNVAEEDIQKSSNNIDFRINTNFRITPTTRFQLQGFYQGPSVMVQGQREDFFMTNVALKKDFFDQKFSATLQVQDIFNTGSIRFVNKGPDYYDEYNLHRESQVVRLSLTYRINNYKKHEKDHEIKIKGFDTDPIMNY